MEKGLIVFSLDEVQLTPTKDYKLLARLNETVQTLHRQRYPEVFQEYSYQAVEKVFKKFLKSKGWQALAVTYQDEVLGYALFCERQVGDNPFRKGYRSLHLEQLSFLPAYQRRGLGHLVMKHLEKLALQKGFSQLELSYWEQNVEAGEFYQKLGFTTAYRFMVKPLP